MAEKKYLVRVYHNDLSPTCPLRDITVCCGSKSGHMKTYLIQEDEPVELNEYQYNALKDAVVIDHIRKKNADGSYTVIPRKRSRFLVNAVAEAEAGSGRRIMKPKETDERVIKATGKNDIPLADPEEEGDVE